MACTRDSVGWNGTESIKGDPMPRDATTRSAATQDERGAERKEAPTPAELREHFTSRGHCIGEQLESRSVASRADADHVGSGTAACALLVLPTLAEGADHPRGRWCTARRARPPATTDARETGSELLELPARARHRHLDVCVSREVLQRRGGVLLLLGRALPHERHERLDAARARNRHLLVMGVCARAACGACARSPESGGAPRPRETRRGAVG